MSCGTGGCDGCAEAWWGGGSGGRESGERGERSGDVERARATPGPVAVEEAAEAARRGCVLSCGSGGTATFSAAAEGDGSADEGSGGGLAGRGAGVGDSAPPALLAGDPKSSKGGAAAAVLLLLLPLLRCAEEPGAS